LAVGEHGRVHRVRVVISNSHGQDPQQTPPKLEILPTPQLSESTYSTRSLLSTCTEARHEALASFGAFPDTIPLAGGKGGGSILRCDLTRDILLLADVCSDTLFSLDDLHCHHPSLLTPLLTSTRHLGLDLAPLLEETADSSYLHASAAIHPELETALVTFVASFPHLEQVYLLQASAAVCDGDVVPIPAEHVFGGGDAASTIPPLSTTATTTTTATATATTTNTTITLTTTSPTPAITTITTSSSTPHPSPPTHKLSAPPSREYYTTRPFPSYRVTQAYYTHLTRLMRFLCQFRQGLDAPAVVTDLMEEAGLVERLEGVKVRLLGHYVAVSGAAGGGGGGGGDDGASDDGEWGVEGSGQGREEERLMLSSPERCLEVALGREPRWVQWEWVCQCLDC
jgi:hypothetical protein